MLGFDALWLPGMDHAGIATQNVVERELAKEGLRLTTPLLPRASKSVVASLLEREPTLIPRYLWSMLDPLRCIEVVFGDGVKMTTGNAANMGTIEEEWEKNLAQIVPSGPQQTDFYRLVSAAQGSMGIVTWASVKCEVLPEVLACEHYLKRLRCRDHHVRRVLRLRRSLRL